jgi:hypothetical protein
MNNFYRDFVDNIVLLIYDTIRGTKRRRYRKELEKTQWMKKEEIEKKSIKKIKKYNKICL